MKYCTKEWYELTQKTGFHLLLTADERAQKFSEEFYNYVYGQREKEQLEIAEESSKARFEDYFDQLDFATLDEYNKAREKFTPPKFDPEDIKAKFAKAQEYNIELLERSLPGYILEKVADIRVLALDYCTNEVKWLIENYCKENEEKTERAMTELMEEEQREFGEKMPEFTKESLHDCEITAVEKDGGDIVVRFNTGGFTDCKGVIFKNAEIVEQDGDLIDAFWLYDEIYKAENGFEIHALLTGEDLKYFTVKCAGTEFIR